MRPDAPLRQTIAEVQAVRRVSPRPLVLHTAADALVVSTLTAHLPGPLAASISRQIVAAYRQALREAHQTGWRDAKRESRHELRTLLQELAPLGKSPRVLTERWHSEIVRVLVRRFGDRAPIVSAAEDVIALMETAIGLAKVAGRREGIVLGRRAADRRRKFVTDHQGD